MEGRQEGVEPLDRAYDLSSLSGEVEAVGRGDRSMQQCRATCTRAIDQFGQVIDVFVSPHRDVKAARRFFRQAIGATKVMPAEVTTDQAPVYPGVLEALLPAAWHRTDQYTNNGDRVRPRPAEGSTATDARPEAGP
jgi:hypothetical protein